MTQNKIPKTDTEPLAIPIWPDTCHLLGISRYAGYEAAKRGEIPTIRIGKRILVPRVALYRLLESAGQPPRAIEDVADARTQGSRRILRDPLAKEAQ